MWYLNRHYSGYHNEKYELTGHAFEQEYYRAIIPSPFLLKRVVRYIHLNPVRANLVHRPESYPWSSLQRLTRGSTESLGDSEKRFLTLFNHDPLQARADYEAFVEKDLKRKVISRSTKTSAWEIWQEQFTWFLEFAQESKERLFPLNYEDVAAWWSIKSGIPPRVIGRALGHEDGRQISQLCFRLSRRLEKEPILSERVQSLGVL
jgi:hypothetical protein